MCDCVHMETRRQPWLLHFGAVYLLVVVVYLFVFVLLDRTLIETQASPNLNQLGRLAR